MKILFKSKLYELEIYRWLLPSLLLFWAGTASVLALQNSKEVLLIGIRENGIARLISSKDDRFLEEELKAFLQDFLGNYYSYSEKSFDQKIALATDNMSAELWSEQKGKLLEISKKLKTEPLSQTFEFESLDLLEEGKAEAILKVRIQRRLSEQSLRLKVTLEFSKNERSHENPWGYVVKGVSDVVL